MLSFVETDCHSPLDLNRLLISTPAATFFVKIEGHSMTGAGLHSGDILIVDRSLKPKTGKIIVALLNGEFTVRRLKIENRKIFLYPEHPDYPILPINSESNFEIWGIVTYAIHCIS